MRPCTARLIIIFLLVLVSPTAMITGGTYCLEQGGNYAPPNTNITLTCAVDNPDGAGNINVLRWIISDNDLSISHVDPPQMDTKSDSKNPQFISTVIDRDNTDNTITAILEFPAKTDLDNAVLECRDISSSGANCTLLIITRPSVPNSVNCTVTSYQSVILQWSPPIDNGGDNISHYNTTWSPSPSNEITEDESLSITDLSPNTEYTFSVSANNSVGFGNNSSTKCTTIGEIPPGVNTISICLGWRVNETVLSINYTDCPVIITNNVTTPPVTNYTISAGQSFIQSLHPSIACSGLSQPVTEGDTYNVSVSVFNIVGANTTRADPFIVAWLRDVNVVDVTNSSAKIQYTTADCVIMENLEIELNIKKGSDVVNSTRVPYSTKTMGIFALTGLQPSATLTYTVQVFSMSNVTIGTAATGSFMVMSTVPSSTPVLPTSSFFTSDIQTPLFSGTPGTTETLTNAVPLIPIIVGVVCGVVFVLILSGFLCFFIYCLKSKKKSKDLEPIPLVDRKAVPETGQALYQDPTTIEHQAAPTGDLYAMPEKGKGKGSRRQVPTTPSAENATYQDPVTIERQQAPTGDLYAMPEKKPKYTEVQKPNTNVVYTDVDVIKGNSGQPRGKVAEVVYSDLK